jgi:hypothetical protein
MTQPTSVLCRGLFPIASMGREHFYPGRRQLFVQRVVVIRVPTENFMRIGGGHTVKRRLQNRGGADCQIAEEGFDSRIESESQLAIDWEYSSADAHFFLERTPADRRNTYSLASTTARDSSAGVQSSQTWKKPAIVAMPAGFLIFGDPFGSPIPQRP